MPLAIDLVLFEPARDVVHGMPVFTSADADLLAYLLRHHGEWSDNATSWLAGYPVARLHIGLRCWFHTREGLACRARLVSHLVHDQHSWVMRGNEMEFRMKSFWYARRRAPMERLVAAPDCAMSRQRGCWFPCDGAIALDASALPSTCGNRLPGLFEALLVERPCLVERWRARAECCFLLHLRPSVDGSACIDIRETPFRDRQGSLVDMHLPVPPILMEQIRE